MNQQSNNQGFVEASTHAKEIEKVYRLQSELLCVFMSARPNSYGPIPEDAMAIGVLASLANLQFGNRRLDQWTDIRNLAADAICMLSSSKPSGIVGDMGVPVPPKNDEEEEDEDDLPVKSSTAISSIAANIANTIARKLDRKPIPGFSATDEKIIRKGRMYPHQLTVVEYSNLLQLAHLL